MDFAFTLAAGVFLGCLAGFALAWVLIAVLERLGRAIENADEWEDL